MAVPASLSLAITIGNPIRIISTTVNGCTNHTGVVASSNPFSSGSGDSHADCDVSCATDETIGSSWTRLAASWCLSTSAGTCAAISCRFKNVTGLDTLSLRQFDLAGAARCSATI